jgi:glucokinase
MMTATGGLAIGVDLGATKIAAALVASDGRILASNQAATEPAQGSPAVLERIAAQVNDLLRRSPGLVSGVGIGSPGQVNSRLGIVRNAVNLSWDEIQLAAEVQVRLEQRLPVSIQKDANLSALGEYYFGAGQGCQDFVYLGIGSGLGGGILSGGHLITGADWNAAELGHLSLDPDGAPCACGLRGCAETVVSGPGLLKLTRQYLAERRFHSTLEPGSALTTSRILQAARSGDELARAALEQLGSWLGMIMAACVAVLNPRSFVIGGGLGLAAFDELAPPAKIELSRRTLPTSLQALTCLPSQVESSAVGAACLVWYLQEETQLIRKEAII